MRNYHAYKIRNRVNKFVVEEKHLTPAPLPDDDEEYLKTRRSGLFEAFQNLEAPHKPNPVTMTIKQTTSMKGRHHNQSKLKSKLKSKKTSLRKGKYSLDEMVRYFVQMYPYQVIAMGFDSKKAWLQK